MNDIFNYIAFIYFTAIFLSIFVYKKFWVFFSLFGCYYFLFKWITNYRKCTISYLEVKFRGVKIDKGILYNSLDRVISLRDCEYYTFLLIFTCIIILINIYKKYKNLLY